MFVLLCGTAWHFQSGCIRIRLHSVDHQETVSTCPEKGQKSSTMQKRLYLSIGHCLWVLSRLLHCWCLRTLALQLPLHQGRVDAVAAEELVMRAALHYLAVGDDGDGVGALDGG